MASLRKYIRNNVRELALTTAMDDCLRWETCVENTKSPIEETLLHDISPRDINTKSPMEEAVLREASPRDTVSVVIPTNAPDLNQMTELRETLEIVRTVLIVF